MIDTTQLENRPIQGGALLPVIVVGGAHVDEIIGGLITVDSVHHEVHEGEMFHAEYLWTSVNNNANADFLIVTGIKYPHTVFSVNAGGACYVYLYEECATTNDGTALPCYNMKRYSPAVCASRCYHTPTMGGLGYQVVGRFLPGGTQVQSRVGGGIRSQTEWLLKPSAKYLLRATNKSGAAISISIALEFYEESQA